jgi:signal transduction histidine kinase
MAVTSEEERWRLALNSAAFGVWDLDPRADLVHYSPQWKGRLGFPESDAPDSTSFWRSRVHPDDLPPMLHALRSHLDGYTLTYEMQFRLRGGNDGYRTVLSRGRVAERDERGNAVRVVGTMVDLSGRRAAGNFGALLEERPSRMSHELRTPLHAILGFSQLMSLRLDSITPEEQRQYLAHIEDAGKRLLGLVDDLLDIGARDGSAQG